MRKERIIYPIVNKRANCTADEFHLELSTEVRVKGLDGAYRFVPVLKKYCFNTKRADEIINFVNKFHYECYLISHLYKVQGDEIICSNPYSERQRLKELDQPKSKVKSFTVGLDKYKGYLNKELITMVSFAIVDDETGIVVACESDEARKAELKLEAIKKAIPGNYKIVEEANEE